MFDGIHTLQNHFADERASFSSAFGMLPVPEGECWALFLDIDGTLSDIAPTPHEAYIPLDLLAKLNAMKGGALALVSGRDLASIDAMTRPYRFAAAAEHGLEIRKHDGEVIRARRSENQALAEISAGIAKMAASHPGLYVERKNASVALHYRKVPEKEELVVAYLTLLAERYRKDFCLQRGKMVGEIRLRGADKGSAIALFMQSAPFAGKRPVFVGDDETDETGFDVVNALGGISVKVGGGMSVATYRTDTPASVRRWLHEILPLLDSASERTKI